MALSAAVIDAMIAAGCTAEQLGAAMKADLAEQEERKAAKRASNAARQRRFKQRNKGEVTHDNAGNALPGVSSVTPLDKEVSPQTPLQEINPQAPPIVPPFSVRFVEAWNTEAKRSGLTEARPLNPDRCAKLKRRVSEFGEEALLSAVAKLGRSPFHCGENDRNWRADIGWLLRSSETVTKALELSDTPARSTGPPSGNNEFLNHFIQRNQLQESRHGP